MTNYDLFTTTDATTTTVEDTSSPTKAKRTYYFIHEHTGKWEKDANGEFVKNNEGKRIRTGRQYLAISLSSLYSKHGKFFADQEAWLEAIIDNEVAQKIGGFSIRVATPEDLRDYRAEMEVFEALEDFRMADKIAAQKKRAAREQVAQWFNDHVTDLGHVEDFFGMHAITYHQFASWIKAWERHDVDGRQKRELAPAALKAYQVFVAKQKSAVLKGGATEQVEDRAATRELVTRAA